MSGEPTRADGGGAGPEPAGRGRERREVPFFPYPHAFRQHREEVEEALLSAAESGAYVLQEEVRRFERRLADYVGVDHAVGVGNATDGMELMMRAVGIGEGDEVIMPAHTFVASAEAAVWNGARPVFAEVGTDHLLDPEDLKGHLTEATAAVMPTQLNGRVAPMDEIRDFAEERGLLLLEDAAQGLGATYRGRMAGSFGVAGAFSFYPAKLLGALGDGGAVVTDDAGVAERVRLARDHGRDPDTGEVRCWGRNSRLDNLQAAVLLVKLEKLDAEIARRRELAARYRRRLDGLEGVTLPPGPEEGGPHFDTYQNYEVEAEDRDGLRAHLAERGIGTSLPWGGKAVHEHPALGLDASLPRTERVLRRAVLLPMNSSLSDGDVDYVCEQVADFYGR